VTARLASGVEVTDEQTIQDLTTARDILRERGIAHGSRFVQRLPGRPFDQCPVCPNAAIGLAVGHGPYPGCLVRDCGMCARAAAARWRLATRIHGGPVRIDPRRPETAERMIEAWFDGLEPTDDEVLAEFTAATATGSTDDGGTARDGDT
jgi:hypothetical protein